MKNKIFYINFYRGLAVLLMFITHAYRLYLGGNPSINLEDPLYRMLNFFALIEPYTSASFLFLVGISVSLTQERKNLKSYFNRALQLYIISFFLFIFEKGWQFPTIIVSSGILSTISFSLVISALLTKIKQKNLLAVNFVISFFSLFLLAYLSKYQISISGLNSGPGGVLPLFLFSIWGLFFGNYIKTKELSKNLLLGSFVCIPSFFIDYPWIFRFKESYKMYFNDPNLFSWLKYLTSNYEFQSQYFLYWNHSSLGFIRILFFILTTTFLLNLINKKIQKNPVSIYLSIIGEKALWGYIMHLIVIGSLFYFELFIPSSALTWGFIFILTLINYLYSRLQRKS